MSNPTVSVAINSGYAYQCTLIPTQERMLFRIGEKEYTGQSAIDIVDALKFDTSHGEHLSVRDFILWSMSQLTDRIPMRELDVSDKLSNEMLALNYLLLRDEYGAGALSGVYALPKATG